MVETNDNDIGNVTDVRSLKEKWEGNGKGIHEGSGQSCGNGKGTGNLPMSENSFREIAGLSRMAPRGHVQTLTSRT